MHIFVLQVQEKNLVCNKTFMASKMKPRDTLWYYVLKHFHQNIVYLSSQTH